MLIAVDCRCRFPDPGQALSPVKALFTADTRFAVHMSGPDTDPTYVLDGREALTPVFEALNQYQATTHFNGQSTVVLDGERAAGESYTIAHHLFTADGRLIRAVRRDLLGNDGRASAIAVRMIWTGDHLDVVRRLQTAIISPARATAGQPAGDRIIPPLPKGFLARFR